MNPCGDYRVGPVQGFDTHETRATYLSSGLCGTIMMSILVHFHLAIRFSIKLILNHHCYGTAMNTNTILNLYKNYSSFPDVPDLQSACESEDRAILPESLWQSPGGSLYKCINGEFICVCVHSSRFQVWLNKVAITNIHQSGGIYFADQAFRNLITGQLVSWEQITLDIFQNKIIKHFPEYLLNHGFVYSLTEVYTRVYEH